MQKYVSEPSKDCDGTYVVSRWDEVKNDYIPLDRKYVSKDQTDAIALILNEEYEKDIYEFEHQNELINMYHEYALSSDNQKRNAARSFFSRFPYQRDVCDRILQKIEH